jgi:hypothetical protein
MGGSPSWNISLIWNPLCHILHILDTMNIHNEFTLPINSNTGWMARFRFLVGGRDSSLHCHTETSSGAHPASYSGDLSSGVKFPGCEADDSHPSTAKVKNVWSCISTHPYCLHGMVLN